MATLYCTYNKTVGWRVVRCRPATLNAIETVLLTQGLLLRIPSDTEVRPGRFCNPARIALSFFKLQRRLSMLTLPADLTYEKRMKFVVPIKDSDPDYYQFGINTRLVCGDDKAAAQSVFQSAEIFDSRSADLFWEGYLYGIERIVEEINSITSKETVQ